MQAELAASEGASPIDGLLSRRSFGEAIKARPTASICFRPPLS